MDITRLLGQNRHATEVAEFLNQFANADTLEIPYHQYWSIPQSGFTFLFNTETNTIITIFLYSSRYGSDFSEYTGALPRNSSFSDNIEDIERRFGSPSRSGERYDDRNDKHYHWYHYQEKHHSTHFEFDDEGRLDMITLSLFRSDTDQDAEC